MDAENPAFTGFFNEGQKRIDLVIVISNTVTDVMQEMCETFLVNLTKFGLEIEVDDGKLPEHKNLIFIKIHAPSPIIEEFGPYFNERKFFKDNHIDFLHPYFKVIGIKYERDLIKIVRNQYPSPVHYSTLERSMIVYKILLQIPFGQYKNHFGINKLINSNVILDAFALHDGPYFIVPKQNTSQYVNARQVLFYNWVGVINIWKMQPIHTIKEYLGERVAFYFAYYEYFNIMLSIISGVGACIAYRQFTTEPNYDFITRHICELGGSGVFKPEEDYPLIQWVCNECRNLTICPFISYTEYCTELKLLSKIDTPSVYFYAFFVTIWGLLLVRYWKRKESYLLWIWELNKKVIENLKRPDVIPQPETFYKTIKRTGISISYQTILIIILRGFILLLVMSIFSGMLFFILVISIKLCYFKNWYRYRENSEIYGWKSNEHKYIAIAAVLHTCVVFAFKIVAIIISYILTECEIYNKYSSYDRSLASKIYGFFFLSTFSLVGCYAFIGKLIYTHHVDINNWYTLEGYGLLNNGMGTSFDDISVTIAVMIVLDQVIFKIPTILYDKFSDYDQSCALDPNIPCWEREYKLPNLSERIIHNSYNAIAMQFAFATMCSCTFPLAPLVIFLMNIWDIRYKARKVLLWHRRPLLLNTRGPGFWHRLIFIAAHFIPIFNGFVLVNQSRYFREKIVLDVYYLVFSAKPWMLGQVIVESFREHKEFAEQLLVVLDRYRNDEPRTCGSFDLWSDYSSVKKLEPRSKEWWETKLFGVEIPIACEAFVLLFSVLIHFLIPPISDDVQDTIEKENRIKQKFNIRNGFLGS